MIAEVALPPVSQIGKYELLRKIAIGGMAEVFLAKAAGPMGFEKTLVVKRILPHLADDPKFVEMFLTEAKLAAQLNHPNVVQIFDFGEAEGAHFLAMEYVDGPNLRALVRRAQEVGKPLDPPVAAKIVSLACEGLAYAHEFEDPLTGQPLGLVHRDVSPDNILVSRTGAVKVVDFGIAKAANKSHQTRTGVLKGKLAYMPPEQLRQLGLDLRVDVFALGMVLYELLTGARPFDAVDEIAIMQAIIHEPFIPVTERRPDTPPALREAIDKAIEKDAGKRYHSCREMQADLERYIVSTGNPVAGYQLAQLVNALAPESAANQPSPVASPRTVKTPISQGNLLATPLPRAAPDVPPPREAPEPAPPPRPLSRLGPPRGTDPHLRPPPQVQRGGQPTNPRALIGAGAGALLLGTLIFALAGRSPAPVAVIPPSPPPSPAPAAPVAPPPEQPGASEPPPKPQGPLAQPLPKQPKATQKAKAVNPLLASLVVESVPVGTVRVNGRVYGKSPATMHNLPPGDVKIEVFDPQAAFSRTETGTLVAGQTLTRKLVLGKAKVEFRIRPYATVFLDGKPLGQTPFEPVEAWEGKHSVKLVNKDLKKEVTVELTVQPGQPNVFKYVMQ
jgi:eukaryotic-like serine/threonine-protein kinase